MVVSKDSLALEDKGRAKDSKVVRVRWDRAKWDTEAATSSAAIMEAGGVGGGGSLAHFVLQDHFEFRMGSDNAAFNCK